MSFFPLASLLAQAAAAPQGQPPFGTILPYFGFMAVIFYFMLIRPQQKKAKEQADLLASVRSGDEVVTTGGLHGVVANARDAGSKTVLVKFAENVKLEVDKTAIVSVTKPGGAVATEVVKAIPVGKNS